MSGDGTVTAPDGSGLVNASAMWGELKKILPPGSSLVAPLSGAAARHLFSTYLRHCGLVDALVAAPGSAAALALRNAKARTPLKYALWCGGRAGIIAALRAHGAPE